MAFFRSCCSTLLIPNNDNKTIASALLHQNNKPQQLHHLPLISLSLSHFICDTCEASAKPKHLQKINSVCWCVVCRAFTCLTDAQGEGKGEGGESEKKERQLFTKLLRIARDRYFGLAYCERGELSVTHSGAFLRTDGEVYY